MSVNKAKTALELRDYLDKIEFKNASMLADNIARVKREVPHLDHGSE